MRPAPPTTIIGAPDRASDAACDLLERNGVEVRWIDLTSDPLGRVLTGASATSRLPLALFPDDTRLEGPALFAEPGLSDDDDACADTAEWRWRLAHGAGLPTVPKRPAYDVVVIGGGPAGLTTAVYAASEGLGVLVIEADVPGGQAATSSRIENYPGFPDGIDGGALMRGTREQAERLGAEILVGTQVTLAEPNNGGAKLTLTGGKQVLAASVVLATGVQYRTLDAPGIEPLIGKGVSYGSSPGDAALQRGRNVVIVGGANSAGQAALHHAEHGAKVTMVVRRKLGATMSAYLIQRIERHRRIVVLEESTVTRAAGFDHLEAVHVDAPAITARRVETILPAQHLYLMIGGTPRPTAVRKLVECDEQGYVVPYDGLRTSRKGIFVVGDARRGAIKRVATAVGDGAHVVSAIHRYLEED